MKALPAVFCALTASLAWAGQDFQITSPAFENGKSIPAVYSRAGGNISPPLAFSNAPGDAKSLALVVDDHDAPRGTWTHWLICDLPPNTKTLPSGRLPAGAVEGRNSWNAARYDGPQPPAGMHHYVFRIYALDVTLPLKRGFSRAEFESAAKGHVMAQAQVIGTFAK